jgi:hypothetical protein
LIDARIGLWACSLLLSLASGCSRGKTAESACHDLRDAILEADGMAVYDALLQNTQWSVSTVQKLHAQMASAITSRYPGPEQAAALARLYAAEADSGRELFWQLYPERYAADFRERVGEQMPVTLVSAQQARCGTDAGKPFALSLGQDGKWGLSELDREWEDAKLRAYHDLETVQKNVELYRRMGERK